MSPIAKKTLHFRSHTISFRRKKKKKALSKDVPRTQMKLIAQEGWGTK